MLSKVAWHSFWEGIPLPMEGDRPSNDWLRDPLTPVQARDLFEIIDDRYGQSSTMVVAQFPVADWHQRIADPTLADAILDRLVHNAHRLELKGESQRKKRSPLAQSNHLEI